MEENKTEKVQEKLRLLVPLAVYRKIMAYVQICELEISGFAEIEYNEARNCFIAGEPYLLEQEVTGSGTHMDENEVSKFNFQYIKKGGTQLPRLWWHSHVNFQAFFSAIDEDTLKQLQNETFIVALVLNKRKEWKAKAYLYSETKSTIMGIDYETKEWIEVDPLPVEVDLEYERIPEVLRKEVDKKVKEKTWKPTVFQRNNKPYTTPMPLLSDGKSIDLRNYLQLPKDKKAAEDRIDKLDLIKEWDSQLEEFVYRDVQSGKLWVDSWNVLTDEEEDITNLLDDVDKSVHDMTDNELRIEAMKEGYGIK